ncbi:class I SAM-dependent methyltransferase [Nocardiopsis kunsanensis]|nr:class I SAM-dependent methyltransferase [Nocardiopsis kunsanensis]
MNGTSWIDGSSNRCGHEGDLYGGLVAEIFPVLAPPELWLDDEEVQRSFIHESGSRSILELGAGYGRVLFRLAQDKLEVHGIEASRDMVLQAKPYAEERNIDPSFITVGDFRDSGTWPEYTVDAVICTDATICLLPDSFALEKVVAAAVAHLSGEGQMMWTLPSGQSQNHQAPAQPTVTVEHGSFRYVIREESILSDKNDELLTLKEIIKFCPHGSLVQRHSALHRRALFQPSEVVRLFRQYGLEKISTHGLQDRVVIRGRFK